MRIRNPKESHRYLFRLLHYSNLEVVCPPLKPEWTPTAPSSNVLLGGSWDLVSKGVKGFFKGSIGI